MARKYYSKGVRGSAYQYNSDLRLQPKRAPKLLPSYWEEDEEGELQPVVLQAQEPTTPPATLSFFSLPAELRVEVYRYCLVAHKPIHPYNDKNSQINCPSGLALNLLRTCKQIYTEGAEVLFGENEFRFHERFEHLDALRFLNRIGPAHRAWLKTLTISTPFTGFPRLILRYENDTRPWGYATYTLSPVYMLWKRGWGCHHLSERPFLEELNISLIEHLSVLPRLKSLSFVLPYSWIYDHHEQFDEDGRALDNEYVWAGLSDLLHTKPFLKVVLVRTRADHEKANFRKNHEQHLDQLRRKLGLWDHRVAVLDQDYGFEFPSATEEDPDESLEDLTLFERGDLASDMSV